ncbi:MAG TPA: bifunctional [glutamate--ammonia ligase]-adenylyl-L-tyrosine phosphorylase/[glutamate--ammonia-ligase] adenylyltransferase [Terriglobales bacterium]|nr:bifunctional [glutamate--ammonia ligase]-adenylyl-L-tyrosine phosphorylase/[glutamate--ammonia-ligase] adenylyltransferase [Terriglobales bacterium]
MVPRKNSISRLLPKHRELIAASPSPKLAENNFLLLLDAGSPTALSKIPKTELGTLFRLLGASVFLSDVLKRQGSDWPHLFRRQIERERKVLAEHLAELKAKIHAPMSFDQGCAALRRHKQREYLRIGARDLMPSVTLEETVRELSVLAEASLDAAYRFCRAEVEQDYGVLHLPGSDAPNRFVILGMGKLGGGELNFSSDIDVIFLYEDDEGESSGGRKGKADPRTFFGEVGKKIIQAMGQVTEDGFVFRIDLRLRPLGVHGPLVQSVHSAMLYYESWGQCWERAAMIKAKAAAGDLELGASFLKELQPFIYRRYLDYTTVEELRHMKLRIENELLSGEDKERNIKLGYGGIREVEFFTQALQLVNGGYMAEVRGASTLPALAALARHKFIAQEECDKLTEAYRFLRQAEHKVQIVQEAHAHSIPEGKDEEQAFARRLGYRRKGKLTERELFWRDYRRQTEIVRGIFDRLFYGAQKEITHQGASAAGSIWQDLDNRELITQALAKGGFLDPAKAYENLLSVRDGEVYAPPSPKRIKVLRVLGPALIDAITQAGAPDQALLNLAKFIHRLGGRTGFLTLLAENPETMRLLITLFSDSQFLTDQFLNRPELIDTLIRIDLTRLEKSKTEMIEELYGALDEASDLEGKLNGLRRYKTEEFIRIGLHDLGGSLDLISVLHQLSDLARACVEGALRLALAELSEKFGPVPGGRFAVIGGGKMGARELDYNSDLDLVFIYDAPDDAVSTGGGQGKLPAHDFYVRIGQKLLTFLSAPTEEGIAYKIDMQLRPSGKFGPIVSSLDAYREYHKTASQLWERQALIKTAFVAGSADLGAEAEQIVERFAYAGELQPDGIAEIHHLRMRMERELAGEDEAHFNLKKGRGGLVDIEFLTQMLQLSYGYKLPALRHRQTLDALAALHDAKILRRREYKLLSEGYLFLRGLDHRLRLERDQSIDSFEANPGRLESIARALGYGDAKKSARGARAASGTKLLRDYQNKREQIRTCYERYFLKKPRA